MEEGQEPVVEKPEDHQTHNCKGQFCLKEMFKVFCVPAASSATKSLWFGILLILASFAVKQFYFNWSLLGVSNIIEKERLSTKKRAEQRDLDGDRYKVDGEKYSVNELDDKIYVIERKHRQEIRKLDLEYEGQMEQLRKDNKWKELEVLRKEKQGKIDKIKTDKDKNGVDDEVEKLQSIRKKVVIAQFEDENEIDDDYREKIRDARNELEWAAVSGMCSVQTALYLKFLLDLLKILGALMIVLSALHITADPSANNLLKVYALVCGAMTLYACFCLGFITMLS